MGCFEHCQKYLKAVQMAIFGGGMYQIIVKLDENIVTHCKNTWHESCLKNRLTITAILCFSRGLYKTISFQKVFKIQNGSLDLKRVASILKRSLYCRKFEQIERRKERIKCHTLARGFWYSRSCNYHAFVYGESEHGWRLLRINEWGYRPFDQKATLPKLFLVRL